MTNYFFKDSLVSQSLKVGPLSDHIDPYGELLSKKGYAIFTAKVKIRLISDFSHWLHQQQLGIGSLDEQSLIKFLQHKRRKGRLRRGNESSLKEFLEYLRKADIIPTPSPEIRD